MAAHELAALLGDTSLTWGERRARLQGWRGADAECAARAVAAQRMALSPTRRRVVERRR